MHTLNYCISLSERYSAWVACGLAEIYDGELYNSQILVNKALDRVHISRKVFLYDDDKLWAKSGPQFQAFDLEFVRLGKTVRVGTGICMDINWKDFEEGKHVNMELGAH